MEAKSLRPIIGLTADRLQELPNRHWLWNTVDYFDAVKNAGGMPVLLPYIDTEEEAEQLLSRMDGILFTGGNDVDPALFGEAPHQKLGSVDPERDTTELLLAKVALRRNMPILGICRGHQLLAVAGGGTLWQDIPAQMPHAIKHSHNTPPKHHPIHTVKAAPGTRLEALLGAEFGVNSRHHQAVKDVPAGWVASAVAPDGINEAMELPGARFAMSVQWHPENFWGRAYSFDRVFRAFVEAAASHR
jgi:putative glutamine amidotransferase